MPRKEEVDMKGKKVKLSEGRSKEGGLLMALKKK